MKLHRLDGARGRDFRSQCDFPGMPCEAGYHPGPDLADGQPAKIYFLNDPIEIAIRCVAQPLFRHSPNLVEVVQ